MPDGYRMVSIFVENLDHDVTPHELHSFLFPHLPPLTLSGDDAKKPHLKSIKAALSPSQQNEQINSILSPIISPASSFQPRTPALRFLSTRPIVPGRSRTSPEDIPTRLSLRNRTQSSGDEILALRRTSLNIAPSNLSGKRERPMSIFGGDKKEGKKNWVDGVPSSPVSPSKKNRPLSGLFRRVSIIQPQDRGTSPIRNSVVVVTAPTPTKSNTERSVSTRGGRGSSTIVHTEILKPVTSDYLAPCFPSRSSSSMDEARPERERDRSPLGRYDTSESINGSLSSRSHTSGGGAGAGAGGWRNLWRKRKGNLGSEIGDVPALVGGRRRASTVGSNSASDSGTSRRGIPQTPTMPSDLAQPMDCNVVIGPSGSLPSIEEDGQERRNSKVAGLVTDVTLGDASDLVEEPESIEWQTQLQSPESTTDYPRVPSDSLDRFITPQAPAEQESPAAIVEYKSQHLEDNIEVMVIPASVTGRPKPRVWGSWPALGTQHL